MMGTVWYNSVGKILAFSNTGAIDGVEGLDSIERYFDPGMMKDTYVLDGEIVQRPRVDDVLVDVNVVSFQNVPVGSTVVLSNEAGDELVLEDFSETVQLQDPGNYVIRVTAPWPYHSHTQVVEIV